MINGPPASPNFKGTGICGIEKGMLPNNIPTTMPMKMVAIFGALSRFSELPINSAMRLTLSSLPTTMMRSPTWKWWLRLAKRSIPCLVMRVTLTPYTLLKCILPSVLPFIFGFVMMILRETMGFSSVLLSHSTSTSGPINALTASASTSAHTIYIESPDCRMVSFDGVLICPS